MKQIYSRVLKYLVEKYPQIESRLNSSLSLSKKPFTRPKENIMSSNLNTIEQLLEKNKQLEEKIKDYVQILESRKKDSEVRIPSDAIIRSKEAQACDQMNELTLDENPAIQTTIKTKPVKEPKTKTELKAKGATKEAAAAAIEKPLDVSRLDLRVGKIVDVQLHPDADSLYVEKIECGDPEGPRTVISGLVKHVPINEMKDRMVVVLCNLKPAKMRGILSEAMVMCASTPEKVELVSVPKDAKPGDRVTFEKFPGEPDSVLNPKKKIWEQVAPDIKTDENGVATYKGDRFRVDGINEEFKSTLVNVNIR